MIDATPPMATDPAYTVTARVLHWITAALVLTMVPLGIVIANEWGGPLQERLYDLHKSIGSLLIPIIIIRLINRLVLNPPLPLPADIPPLQQLAAHTTHWALYALLLVQPLVGWIGTSAYPAPVPFFGWFNLRPDDDAASLARHHYRCGCRHAHRGRASPPFRAQGSRPDAHAGWRLTVAT
jgi:cytochrome b561